MNLVFTTAETHYDLYRSALYTDAFMKSILPFDWILHQFSILNNEIGAGILLFNSSDVQH